MCNASWEELKKKLSMILKKSTFNANEQLKKIDTQ